MNLDEIIRMAQEAGIKGPESARLGFKMYANPQRLGRFAALVAAAEREACVVAGFHACVDPNESVRVREAIRARGQS